MTPAISSSSRPLRSRERRSRAPSNSPSSSASSSSSSSVSIAIDSEQTAELVAYGTGATSAISGQVYEYDPTMAGQFQAP